MFQVREIVACPDAASAQSGRPELGDDLDVAMLAEQSLHPSDGPTFGALDIHLDEVDFPLVFGEVFVQGGRLDRDRGPIVFGLEDPVIPLVVGAKVEREGAEDSATALLTKMTFWYPLARTFFFRSRKFVGSGSNA